MINRHLAFPYTYDRVSAGGEVFILRLISLLLGGLPISQRLKAWMAMPVIAVGLNDGHSNTTVNRKLSFDYWIFFIRNPKLIKNFKKLNLKFCWVDLTASLSRFSKYLIRKVCVLNPKIGYLFTSRFILHWVINGFHPSFCAAIKNSIHRVFGYHQPHSVCRHVDTLGGAANLVGAPLSAALSVICADKLPVLVAYPASAGFSVVGEGLSISRVTRSANRSIGIVSDLAANLAANALHLFVGLYIALGYMLIAALLAAKSSLFISRVKRFPAKFAGLRFICATDFAASKLPAFWRAIDLARIKRRPAYSAFLRLINVYHCFLDVIIRYKQEPLQIRNWEVQGDITAEELFG